MRCIRPYLVGFADDKNEPKEYVIVERALEFDEQDITEGKQPSYHEVSPGHTIYCSDEEFEEYKKEWKA